MSYKERIGREVWQDVHTIARFNPELGCRLVGILRASYPCRSCRNHFQTLTEGVRMTPDEVNRQWWQLHNQVNTSNGQRARPWRIVQQYNDPRYWQRYCAIMAYPRYEERLSMLDNMVSHYKLI